MSLQQKQSQGTTSIIFNIMLLIVIAIVIMIQLTIIVTYFINLQRGRCIYQNKNCACQYTNKKSCESLKGQYDPAKTCENACFDNDTHHM